MARTTFWMECFADNERMEGDDPETVEDLFVAHAADNHDWQYTETALRIYARNYAEANVRLIAATDRLEEIGPIEVHPMTEDRVDDWLEFFDHRGFAGNPDWASCYCIEPHLAPSSDDLGRPWRQTREAMIERLRSGATFGYLAYVDGEAAGWVNASLRSEYQHFGPYDADGPDPSDVVGVSCFVVAPPYRRHGVARRLLDRVIADAPARGAEWVEAYPRNQVVEGAPGHFRGPRGLYDSQGFTPVAIRQKDTVVRRRA